MFAAWGMRGKNFTALSPVPRPQGFSHNRKKKSVMAAEAERKSGALTLEMNKSKGGGDVKSENHLDQREPSEFSQAKQTANISDT